VRAPAQINLLKNKIEAATLLVRGFSAQETNIVIFKGVF
jgi:hypothetical protein